tara:strand:+ start:1271 stop:1879 length:609 start_codon:yes stop_codon:yes gene_type:complete
MSRLIIDTGIEGNKATGDTLRTAMTKINTNFEEIYQLTGDPDTGLLTNSKTNGDVKVQPNGTGVVEIDQLQINNAAITPIATNSDLTLSANGTGAIQLGSATVARTGDLTVDTSGFVVIDAGSGDIYLKDDGQGFGILSNSAGNLEIKSGNTTAISMSGANVTTQGNLTVTGAQINFAALPTSDPGVAGRLYRDGGTVKVSI